LSALVGGVLPGWPGILAAVVAGGGAGYFLWRMVVLPAREAERETAVLTTRLARSQAEVANQARTAVALRQQTEHLQSLFDLASDIIYVLDMEGIVVFVNRAIEEIMGYRPEEVLGKHFVVFTGGIDEDTLWNQLHEGGISRYEFTFENNQGQPIILELNGHFMIEAGQPVAILGIVRDISKRKREQAELRLAKEAAEKAAEARTVFLANMGHELRTPLSVIIGYADIMGQDALSNGQDEYWVLAQKIKQAAQQLRTIVNDVLEITEIETGQVSFLLESFDITAVIKRVVNSNQTAVEANDNELLILIPPDIGFMFADQDKVQRALENLLNNAAKFTHNGSITLSVTRSKAEEQEWVVFQVADTGIGIAPEQHDRIFHAFEQVDKSFTRGYGGTGLGLAINQYICRAMGGKISFTSELGRGSTFTMQLPAKVTAVDSMYVRTR